MGLRRGSAAPCPAALPAPGPAALPLLLLLLLPVRDARARSEFQTSSVYLWKTGKSGCCDNAAAVY